jgi:hypothetical protein
MWFRLEDFRQGEHTEAIAQAIRRRDPHAFVRTEAQGVRIVARLDLRRMLEAIAETGLAATPECRLDARAA